MVVCRKRSATSSLRFLPPSDIFEIDFSSIFYLNNVFNPPKILSFQLKIDNHSNDAEIFRLRKVCTAELIHRIWLFSIYNFLCSTSCEVSLRFLCQWILNCSYNTLFFSTFWERERKTTATACVTVDHASKMMERPETQITAWISWIEVNYYHWRVNVNRRYHPVMTVRCYN